MIKEYLTNEKRKYDEKQFKSCNLCVRARNEHICNESSERSVIERKEGGNKMFRSGMRYALTWILYTKRAIAHSAHTHFTHTNNCLPTAYSNIITNTVYSNRATDSWA